jgi:hypothetical protein
MALFLLAWADHLRAHGVARFSKEKTLESKNTHCG